MPSSPFQIQWPQPDVSGMPPEISLAAVRQRMSALAAVGWRRLAPECDDVLNMLCEHTPATQWTLGWGPGDQRLYLLLWRKDAWRAQKRWSLWVDGAYHFEWADVWHSRESRLCRDLMEGPRARNISASDLLRPLSRQTASLGGHAFYALEKCLLAHPFLWNGLKDALFDCLSETPRVEDASAAVGFLFDLTPLQRLESVLPLLSLMIRVMKVNPLVCDADRARFDAIRQRLLAEHCALGRSLAPALRPAWEQSSRRLHYLLPVAARWASPTPESLAS